jgi:predicted metal-dependent phosphoesterase TrpH
MHTTASDGTLAPEDLIDHAHRVGIEIVSVTDHDTMAGVARATEAARAHGMTVIPGIEITSVHGGKDVHVLAYFLPDTASGLQEMLAKQRQNRIERATEIARRLASLGAPIDLEPLLDGAARSGGKALARPQIARALIAAGHVSSVAEAFDRFLNESGPAYVPHRGASPADVVALIVGGGGLSSLAHPGYTKKDEVIPELVDAGLVAIEAYHSSHEPDAQQRYIDVAKRYGLAVSGGSDFHGPGTRRSEFFGVTQLPEACYDELLSRLSSTAAPLI